MTNNQNSQAELKVHAFNKKLNYEGVKKMAIERQPIVTHIPLSRFDLGRNQTLKIDGQIMPLSEGSYNGFLKRVLEVNPAFVKKFKEATDEKTELSMLNVLKEGLHRKKKEMATIVANPFNHTILGFAPSKSSFTTNESMFSTLELIMNRYPQLELRDLEISDSGELSIGLRTSKEVSFGTKQNVEENYLGGISMFNSPFLGSKIGHQSFRIACFNSMLAPQALGSRYGFNMTKKEMEKLFKELDELAKNNFMYNNFDGKIERAINTKASVRELHYAVNVLKNNSKLDVDGIHSFLGFNAAEEFLETKGVSMGELNEQQRANCPTDMNVWDLVNRLTYFGSHNMRVDQNYSRIQASAGALMNQKNFDIENLVFLN